jgi:uncharacterized protein (TIGR02246 family)
MSTVRDAIQEVNEAFLAAVAAGDAAGMAAVYTEDGQVLPPGGETVTGKAAIEAFWQGVIDALGMKGATLESVELEVQGDTAVQVGKFTILGAGDSLVDHGKYIVIWKREAGAWKWHRDIFNSSVAS